MDTGPDHKGLARMLAWYRDMGVDAAIAIKPVDWAARGDTAPGSGFTWQRPQPPADTGRAERVQPATPEVLRQATPEAIGQATPAVARPTPRSAPLTESPRMASTGAQAATIRSFAAAPAKPAPRSAAAARVTASSLAELESELHAFEGCGLKATAKNLCLYRGAAWADLMVIGEAPGREEDLAGKPFVGPAGQLLDKMLAAIGRTEANVHITNVVYWRPPGNREPSPQETLVCAPFLARQIELVSPKVIVLLGGACAQGMLGSAEGIMRLRGKWHAIDSAGGTIRAMATLHPAYVLQVPASKRQVWRDLLAVQAALGAG